MDWPIAPYPRLRYPYADHEHENRQEEDRCLESVRRIIGQRKDKNNNVGAIIIEPISQFNNMFATPYFFKRLR